MLAKVRFIFLLASIAGIGACTDPPRVTVSERSVNYPKTRIIAVSLPRFYEVKKGDTLFSIAWITGLDYTLLAKWNGIKRPWRIYQGQRLRLREPVYSSQARHPRGRQKAPHNRTASQTRKTATVSRNTLNNHPVRRWLWPAKGRVISRFNPTRGRKGIAIKGLAGSDVRAAAPGRIVYAGHGLRGYGNLVIIKHNARFLSAYAYNQTLLVREGQQVRRGQRIARMGSSGSNRTQLHFEVRRYGQPIDPLLLLPRRR